MMAGIIVSPRVLVLIDGVNPSEAELRNGMPFHGEAARVRWREFDAPEARDGRIIAAMGATLPMAGLEVRRAVRLSETTAMFSVSETVSNRNQLGRIYNMVQHATIGPPFLDETTVVDSNAQRGFMQSNPMPNPEQPETRWPEARKQGQPVDLRHLTSDPDPNVVSFVIDGEFGWSRPQVPRRSYFSDTCGERLITPG
jgi:hypothetical protein